MDQERYIPEPPPAFGAWLVRQGTRNRLVGSLAAAAGADRRFPRQDDPEAVRTYLRNAMADGDMFDAVEDAEADWRALVSA